MRHKEAVKLLKEDPSCSEWLELSGVVNYELYLKSPQWRDVRMKVLRRDEFKCVKCSNTKGLNVHHESYRHLGNESEFLNDLITLCSGCHVKVHKKKQKVRAKKRKRKITFKKKDKHKVRNQKSLADVQKGRTKYRRKINGEWVNAGIKENYEIY